MALEAGSGGVSGLTPPAPVPAPLAPVPSPAGPAAPASSAAAPTFTDRGATVTTFSATDPAGASGLVPLGTGTALETRVPASQAPFTYARAGLPLPDPNAAKRWKVGSTGLSGTQANIEINQTYHALNTSFNSYLNPPPYDQAPLPNWATYGQYASREAGTVIHSLEVTETTLNDTRHALEVALEDPNPVSQARAVAQVVKDLLEMREILSKELGVQGAEVFFKSIGLPTAKDLVTTANPITFAKHLLDRLGHAKDTAGKMHDAFVLGNTGIYNSIAPAYQAFMTAESRGEDGMAALKAAGYDPQGQPPPVDPASPDPNGWVAQAFQNYKDARGLAAEAAALPAGDPRRQALEVQRRQLVDHGNLLIGLQEQYAILQVPQIYGDPDVAGFVNQTGGQVFVHDPNHAGFRTATNWADFGSRMGLQAVSAPPYPANAIAVPNADGSKSYYVPIQPAPNGTILQYFGDYTTDPGPKQARRLIEGSARPYK